MPRLRMIHSQRTSGIALVITLLVIVILTIAVTAFMQSMSLERRTSQAYLNRLAAESAAQAGLEKAVLLLDRAIANRRTYVTAAYQPKNADGTINTSLAPVLVLSSVNADTDVFSKPIPVVSRAQNDAVFERATANPLPATVGTGFTSLDTDRSNANASVATVDLNRNEAIQAGAPAGYYRVPLENLVTGSGAAARTVAAYGFYVSDEQARIAPAFHRSVSRVQAEDYPADASDIPLDLGIDAATSKPRLFSAAAVTALPTAGLVQLSPYSMAQAFSAAADFTRVKHLLGGYRTFSEEVIPAGFPGAGLPKYDINDRAKNTSYGATATLRAENLAGLIDAQLPAFKNRDAALVASGASASVQKRYLNRLAASIVDYIDTDNAATLVNTKVPNGDEPPGEPAGRDLFPMVVAVAEKLQRGPITGAPGNYSVTFTTQLYIQVWNPYTQPATGIPRFKLGNRMRVSFGTGIVTPLSDYDQTAPSVTVRPNEMKVIAFPSVTQAFTSPTSADPRWTNNSPAETADQTTHLYFQFSWGGVLADMNRRPPVSPSPASSGLTRSSKTFNVTTPGYQVSLTPSNAPGGGGWRFAGDPRSTYLSNYDWGGTISSDASYGSSTRWGGRQMDTQPRWQDYAASWTARDYVRTNVNFGTAPGTVNTAPDAVPSPYNPAVDGKNAPAYIRNNSMRSIGELGHIYDPAQADDSGAAPSGGSPSSVFVSAGGRTLRIGQPEFAYWGAATEIPTDTPANKIAKGKRATLLLDILTTATADRFLQTGYPQSQGRINVNTAPKEVLAALFYQLGLYTDQTGASACVIDYDAAAALAQYLIDRRPFHKLSDLHLLTEQLLRGYTTASGVVKKTSYTPEAPFTPLLQPTVATDPALNSLALMDRAREEVFNRILNAVTVQSRAYRVHVHGRTLNALGKVSAQVMLEAVVEFEPLPVDPANPTYVRIKPRIASIRFVN